MNVGNNFLFAGINFGLRIFNNLVIFSLLARVVGLASFGLISYLIALISLLSVISVFGFRMLIVKEVAVDPSIVNSAYVTNKLALISMVFMIAFSVLALYLYPKDLNIPLYFILAFCFNALFIALSNFILSFFHAINKFHLESWCLILFTSSLLVGLYFTYSFDQMRWFMLFYSIGSVLMFLVCIYMFFVTYKNNTAFEFNLPDYRRLNKDFALILPFAIISIGDIFFNTIDTLIIEAMVSKEDLGVYVAAMKIALGLGLISIVAYSALFPILSKLAIEKSKQTNRKVVLYFLSLISIGTIVPIIYLCFDTLIINLFLGNNFGGLSTYSVDMFSKDIALYTFSRHAIVIPAIILVVKGFELKRLFILLAVLIISSMLYYLLVPIYGLQVAFRICSISNFILFVLYLLSILYLTFISSKKQALFEI